MKEKLTQERLKELLHYDPETGVFIWKVDRGNKKKGSIAGTIDKYGYCVVGIDKKAYKAHRLVFLYIDGYIPENEIDHIDRNPLNNKRDNLRESSHICNLRNRPIFKNNKSMITGVYWCNRINKWRSRIQVFKKNISMGYFDNIIDAVKARWEAEVKYGFPNCNTTSSAYMYLKEKGAI